jgi:hypothetical protein
MGIYPNHGVEYHLILKNNKRYIIANTTETDNRLVKSKYYEDRKEKWFEKMYQYCTPLIEDGFDIQLTEDELKRLHDLLDKHKNEIDIHGWYDVCTITDTYGSFTCSYHTKNGYYVILKNKQKIWIGPNKNLNDHELTVLNSIFNVYDNQVESHGYI